MGGVRFVALMLGVWLELILSKFVVVSFQLKQILDTLM